MPQAQDGDQIEEDEIAQFKPADEVWRLGGLCHIGRWKMEDRRWEANAPEVPPSREATARQAKIRKELQVYLSSTVRLIHEGRRRQSNTAWTRTVFASTR